MAFHLIVGISETVQLFEVFLTKPARYLLQEQQIEDVVVVRIGVIELRSEQELLCLQHVDDVTGAYFVARLSRFQSRLG